jgi:hypothetical protein
MDNIMAEYLTQEGVHELHNRAHAELKRRNEPRTNREIARLLGISVRTFYYLTSDGQGQSPISHYVRASLQNVLKFTEKELALYTASRAGCKRKRKAKRTTPVGDALADVAALRNMKSEDRIRLYEQWRSARARYDVPQRPPLDQQTQREHQKRLPIDLRPLKELLRAINVREWEFTFPITPEEFCRKYTGAALRQFRNQVFKSLQEVLANAGQSHTATVLKRIESVTDYLCYEEPLGDGETADLAFVPGYRSHLRAELAGELFSKGLVDKIYLSGHSPSYAKGESEPLPLTEALAMAVYLIDLRRDLNIGWDDLVIEPRPHCTKENVTFSEQAFGELANQFSRPLKVLIVTSPYHLRRTWLMMKSFAQQHPNLVGAIKCMAAPTKPELEKDKWYTNPDGVTAYMTDYWKIYGGRVVGEY